MGAYKGHFRIICAVCERLIKRGRKGSDTVVGVCDDCRTLSHIEATQTATEAGRAIADSVNNLSTASGTRGKA